MNPKFRAWDKLRKRMSTVDRIYFDTEGVQLRDGSGLYWRDFRNIALMQSTGIKDKNGTEIFEGDVVRFSHLSGYPFDGFLNRVIWDEHNAAFKLVPLDKTWSDTYFSNFEGDTLKSLEVIGNVCEKDKLEEAINDPK